MRRITFKVPQEVYNHMKVSNSEMLNEPQYNIKISEIKNNEDGLVCLNCGNRGDSAPIEMVGYSKAKIKFTKDGELDINIDTEISKKRYERALTFEYWGMGVFGPNSITNSSGELFRCLNCNSGLIILADLALESCRNRGCSGCFVCNNYDLYEDVLDLCAECNIATDVMVKDDWKAGEDSDKYLSELCADMDCPTLFARESVYNIKVNDILMRMRIL